MVYRRVRGGYKNDYEKTFRGGIEMLEIELSKKEKKAKTPKEPKPKKEPKAKVVKPPKPEPAKAADDKPKEAKTRGPQRRYMPGEYKENEYTGMTFAEAVQAYYRSITYEEEVYKWVETGEFNAKGRPILERQPVMVEKNGEKVQAVKTGFIKPPTIYNLCLAIGISADTFRNYEKRDDYNAICTWWRLVCEAYTAELLQTKEGSVQGQIFTLTNNFGWKDRQEVAVSGAGGLEKYLETLADGNDGKSGQTL